MADDQPFGHFRHDLISLVLAEVVVVVVVELVVEIVVVAVVVVVVVVEVVVVDFEVVDAFEGSLAKNQLFKLFQLFISELYTLTRKFLTFGHSNLSLRFFYRRYHCLFLSFSL